MNAEQLRAAVARSCKHALKQKENDALNHAWHFACHLRVILEADRSSTPADHALVASIDRVLGLPVTEEATA